LGAGCVDGGVWCGRTRWTAGPGSSRTRPAPHSRPPRALLRTPCPAARCCTPLALLPPYSPCTRGLGLIHSARPGACSVPAARRGIVTLRAAPHGVRRADAGGRPVWSRCGPPAVGPPRRAVSACAAQSPPLALALARRGGGMGGGGGGGQVLSGVAAGLTGKPLWQVLSGVAYLHREGAVHWRLKPSKVRKGWTHVERALQGEARGKGPTHAVPSVRLPRLRPTAPEPPGTPRPMARRPSPLTPRASLLYGAASSAGLAKSWPYGQRHACNCWHGC
jgi:hypothetical protein